MSMPIIACVDTRCVYTRVIPHTTEVHSGSTDSNRGVLRYYEGGRLLGSAHQEFTAHQAQYGTGRKGAVRLLQLDVQRSMQPTPQAEPTGPCS